MPRGGRRVGAPGKAYPNRQDLTANKSVPMMAASGQQYGAKAEQMAAQRALPMARPATDAVPQGPPAGAPPSLPAPAGPAGPPQQLPGQVVPLSAPSSRPNEPITAGMDMGAGAGSEALGGLNTGGQDVSGQLRAIYSRFPNEDLRSLLELLDSED